MAKPEDLDLDNLNLQDEDEELEQDGGQEEDDDESPPSRGGNVAKALQEERRQRRELQRQMAEAQEQLKRANAFMERLGNGQQQQQRQQQDPTQYREQLQTWMLERPDEFYQAIQRQAQESVLQQVAPVLALQAERIITRNDAHKAVYEVPEIRDVVDQFIANQVETGGITSLQDLQQVVNETMDAIVKIRGAATSKQADPAKGRLSSTVGKGGGGSSRKSAEEIWAEKRNLARTNRTEYTKWANSPEGKKVRAALYLGAKASQ